MAVDAIFVQFEGFPSHRASKGIGHSFRRKTVATRNDLGNGRMDPDLEKHALSAVVLWGLLFLVAMILL